MRINLVTVTAVNQAILLEENVPKSNSWIKLTYQKLTPEVFQHFSYHSILAFGASDGDPVIRPSSKTLVFDVHSSVSNTVNC